MPDGERLALEPPAGARPAKREDGEDGPEHEGRPESAGAAAGQDGPDADERPPDAYDVRKPHNRKPPENGILINVARAGIVDNDALGINSF